MNPVSELTVEELMMDVQGMEKQLFHHQKQVRYYLLRGSKQKVKEHMERCNLYAKSICEMKVKINEVEKRN